MPHAPRIRSVPRKTLVRLFLWRIISKRERKVQPLAACFADGGFRRHSLAGPAAAELQRRLRFGILRRDLLSPKTRLVAAVGHTFGQRPSHESILLPRRPPKRVYAGELHHFRRVDLDGNKILGARFFLLVLHVASCEKPNHR